jgi:hypothetical protein
LPGVYKNLKTSGFSEKMQYSTYYPRESRRGRFQNWLSDDVRFGGLNGYDKITDSRINHIISSTIIAIALTALSLGITLSTKNSSYPTVDTVVNQVYVTPNPSLEKTVLSNNRQ